MVNKLEIRNSTAEFLTFVAAGKEDGIQVLYKKRDGLGYAEGYGYVV